uniref:Uncharacterized protein n=1 Tax=Anguilla anguilla TaxID=7936 RepID=A0A0E9XV76_ANGAN
MTRSPSETTAVVVEQCSDSGRALHSHYISHHTHLLFVP